MSRASAALVLSLLPLLLWPDRSYAQVKTGDSVIVRRDDYMGATVVGVTGSRLEVRIGEDEPVEIAAADVIPVKAAEKSELFTGDLVLHNTHGNYWWLMEVGTVGDDKVYLVESGGDRRDSDRDSLCVIPAPWLAKAREQWTKAESLAAIRPTRRPFGTGTAVRPGDVVLACEGDRVNDSWIEAKVKSVDGDRCVVTWLGGMKGQDMRLARSRIAPAPMSGQKFKVAVGDVVFWRNTTGDHLFWHPARVDRVDGDRLYLTLSSAEEVDAEPGEYLPQK